MASPFIASGFAGSASSPSPARPRSPPRPEADKAQPISALAMRRRARSTACARVSSWVGLRTSFSASCSTRSSRCTSSPSSHREAQASRKWVRAMKPSRIGLVRSLSSSRASASSAVARGAAIRGQGNRSAIPARSDISGRMRFAPPFGRRNCRLARRSPVPLPRRPPPHASQGVTQADLKP